MATNSGKFVDLHFIPSDKMNFVLQLLLDNGVITSSKKGVRLVDLRHEKLTYPHPGCFFEVYYDL